MKNILMVIHGLNFTNGGITKVMLNRSHFFNDLGYTTKIVTFESDKDYYALEKKFKESGRLHSQSNIVNLFSYYEQKNNLNKIVDEDHELIIYEKNFLIQDTYLKTREFLRYFNKNGELIKCKYFSDKNLNYVEYYDNNIVIYTKYYINNKMYKIINLDSDGKDIQVRFFTNDGFCYFQRSFLGDNRLLHLFLFDRESNKAIGFNSYQKLHTFFLEELCLEERANDNIIICDGPGSAEKVANVSSLKAKKILTIHSNHFVKPYTFGSGIKEGIEPTLRNIDKVDNIIVLTPSQENDLVQQFGNNHKFIYIPNTINIHNDVKKNKNESATKKINIISRYVAMKHHEHVIKAISQVVDKIDHSLLEVNFYGNGPEKENLENLVNQLNLNKIISINDYTTDIDDVFLKADLTVFTSSYEGFGLTIIEAMSNKTPVISYNINYGPKDIISHGEDGFLVPYGDIDCLSTTIYESLFTSQVSVSELGENAFKKVKEKFSHDLAKSLWKNLIEG